jgi:hypothetical protein
VVIITDHDPAVELAITSIFSGTIHHLYIYHIVNINFPRNLGGMLRGSYDDFIKDFYVVRKQMSDYYFEEGWKQLLLQYPLAKNYLASYYYV